MAESLLRTNEELSDSYGRHVDMVYRVCFAYLKNAAEAEDAVQDTFIRLLQSERAFQSNEHEKAWLIVTATNLCKDRLRHWWHRRERLADHEGALSKPPFEIDETLRAVMELPSKYKTVTYLYYYEGYTSSEISQMLHRPSSTIRNYLHEVRAILRQRLGGGFDEE